MNKGIKKDLKIKVIALMALIALWIFLLIRTPSFEELLASFIMFGVLLIIFIVGIYSDLKALKHYMKLIEEQEDLFKEARDEF